MLHVVPITQSYMYVKLARDGWTDESKVEKLSAAMRIITTIAKDRGLMHTTEVVIFQPS